MMNDLKNDIQYASKNGEMFLIYDNLEMSLPELDMLPIIEYFENLGYDITYDTTYDTWRELNNSGSDIFILKIDWSFT